MADLNNDVDSDRENAGESSPETVPTWSQARAVKEQLPIRFALSLMLVLALGLGGGFLLGRLFPAPTAADHAQAKLPQSFTLPVSYGNIGPALLAAGAIDRERFAKLYAEAGRPLTEDQIAILTEESSSPIVIDAQNAHFLLNLFWAFGLTNTSPILQTGPMAQYKQGAVTGFASTAGWTLGTKPATTLYSSVPIVELTAEQSARVEEVASAVYRPCCANPTWFPDCNHGMAMLGLLELMASQGATTDDMFTAVKYVNAFWFPQQALELATYFQATQSVDFAEADPRVVVGKELFSAPGFQAMHRQLLTDGLLPQAPGGGNNCGV